MTKRFARGLVVGKFSPLHRGHEYIIEEAFRQCEAVVIISYSEPEFENCGRENRERWLASRFSDAIRLVVDDDELHRICATRGIPHVGIPHNDAGEDEHRQFVGWLCSEILGTTVDAAFTSEDYGDGFAAALAQRFGANVAHVCVDRERNTIPVSGTVIRADPHAHRSFLSPIVYASFIRRVAILGAESSGKTTLAQALARRFDTVWVPEYGRELWERRSGRLNLPDMVDIARQQIQHEDATLLKADRWLFCDTTPLTTAFYSQALFDRVEPELAILATRRYDDIVLCEPDFGLVQDGTRQTAAFQTQQHRWYVDVLSRLGRDVVRATGQLENRVSHVASKLKAIDAESVEV